MKALLRLTATAALSFFLLTGVSLALTGCSADTLTGPDVSSYATGGGESTDEAGDYANTGKTSGGGESTDEAGDYANTGN